MFDADQKLNKIDGKKSDTFWLHLMVKSMRTEKTIATSQTPAKYQVESFSRKLKY